MKKITLALLCFTLANGAFAANESIQKFRMMKAAVNNSAPATFEGFGKKRIINASANHSIKIQYQFCSWSPLGYSSSCQQPVFELTIAANSYKDIDVPANADENLLNFASILEVTGYQNNNTVSHTAFISEEIYLSSCSVTSLGGVIVLNDYNTDLVVCDNKQAIF